MWPVMDQKLEHFRKLEEQLADPAIAGDHKKFAVVAKEHGMLARIVKPYLELLDLDKALKETEAMVAGEKDPELKAMAAEELASIKPKHEALKNRIEDELLIDPDEIFDSLIVE